MERHGYAQAGIERVDYDTEYGLLADDATAGCLLEAAEYFGPGLDVEDMPMTRVPAQAGTSGGVALDGGRPQPALGLTAAGVPAEVLRQAQDERTAVPDGTRPQPALGLGGGRSPQRPGPEPLLTRPLQATFCEHLARHGNVRLACRAAGVSPQTAYRMRRACGQFRALWYAALVIAREQVEDVLADRAIHGWEEAVFYHGEEVARRRRYDSRLLLAHLARLDRLAERAAGGVVERFDAALDVLAADGELVLAPAEAVLAPVSGVVGVPAEATRVPAQAGPSGSEAPDCERPQPALGLSDDGTPLLEAQLCWLDEQYGPLDEEEEVFHLLHTVPGVPGSTLRRFGWKGSAAELAADHARWAARRAVWEAEQELVPAQAGTSGEVAQGGGRPQPALGLNQPDALSPAAARC